MDNNGDLATGTTPSPSPVPPAAPTTPTPSGEVAQSPSVPVSEPVATGPTVAPAPSVSPATPSPTPAAELAPATPPAEPTSSPIATPTAPAAATPSSATPTESTPVAAPVNVPSTTPAPAEPVTTSTPTEPATAPSAAPANPPAATAAPASTPTAADSAGNSTQPAPTNATAQKSNSGKTASTTSMVAKKLADPAIRKQIITVAAVGGGAIVLITILAVVLTIFLHIDYGEAYHIAKEARSQIQEIHSNSACNYVADYVNSTTVKVALYDTYIDGCRTTTSGLEERITKLGETAAVKRNTDIRSRYEVFKETFESALPSRKDLEQKLNWYQAWHEFTYLESETNANADDATVHKIANNLIDSGNETLAEYGEAWLERTITYYHAYQKYWDTDYGDEHKADYRGDMESARIERSTWIAANRLNIAEVAPLGFSNLNKMYNDYLNLYAIIAKAYEQNYNKGSGDCNEFLGEVSCS